MLTRFGWHTDLLELQLKRQARGGARHEINYDNVTTPIEVVKVGLFRGNSTNDDDGKRDTVDDKGTHEKADYDGTEAAVEGEEGPGVDALDDAHRRKRHRFVNSENQSSSSTTTAVSSNTVSLSRSKSNVADILPAQQLFPLPPPPPPRPPPPPLN